MLEVVSVWTLSCEEGDGVMFDQNSTALPRARLAISRGVSCLFLKMELFLDNHMVKTV